MESYHSSILFSKIHGCLAGGAIGDAMGGPTEMMHYKTIQRLFGEVRDLLPYGETAAIHKGRPAGSCTDDTILKHLLCRAIIKKGGRVTAADMAEVWREEMNPRDFYVPVQNSYYKLMLGNLPPREIGRGNMISNSSAMAIAPVGIINACNPQQAVLDAYEVSSLIHSGFPQEAACAVAAAVAEAFNPEATPDSVGEAAVVYLDGAGFRPYVERAISLARECREYTVFREQFYNRYLMPWPRIFPEGYEDTVDPREAVPCALALFYLARGRPETAVLYAANFGRDCDTIGTIAGAIAGAFSGVEAIPRRWIELVEQVNSIDNLSLAEQMFQAVANNLHHLERQIELVRRLQGGNL
ncbi:MAG: ADP-ribosylglycohydrolase family protein [Chloroflexi bacterium]|nr:ADP-ribosylglycohydrolase family protein [Chloroflexota bacterium]MCL5076366.1 ADP-ribosylglycohydrolase family protein [Chloroflexota bacterium]